MVKEKKKTMSIDEEKYQEFLARRREKNKRVLKKPKVRFVFRRIGENLLDLFLFLLKFLVPLLVLAVVGSAIYFIYPLFSGEWFGEMLRRLVDYKQWGEIIKETWSFVPFIIFFFFIVGIFYAVLFIYLPKGLEKLIAFFITWLLGNSEKEEETEGIVTSDDNPEHGDD